VDGETDVPLDANVVLELTGPFTEEGFDAWLIPETVLGWTVSEDRTVVTLNPNELLEPDTTYTMTILALTLDDGRELSDPYEFTFRTVQADDPDSVGSGSTIGGGCGAGIGMLFVNLLIIWSWTSRRRASS
jgi:hypothetical protein